MTEMWAAELLCTLFYPTFDTCLVLAGNGGDIPAVEAALALLRAVAMMGVHSAAVPFVLRALQPFISAGVSRHSI